MLMTSAVPSVPCRTYIVYHHGLFAQGVRSILENRRAVQVVGMESDAVRALKAVRSLKPEVVIVEESPKKYEPMRLRPFLECASACRVVTLSLDHVYATVYNQQRIPASDPAQLVKAIRGVSKARSASEFAKGPGPAAARLGGGPAAERTRTKVVIGQDNSSGIFPEKPKKMRKKRS